MEPGAGYLEHFVEDLGRLPDVGAFYQVRLIYSGVSI